MTNKPFGTLYIGVTNDLKRRVLEHKNQVSDGFTKKHDLSLLVWYEETSDISMAITREKQMKAWKRDWKIKAICKNNPQWKDLFELL
jgi:putative endonuclease